MTQYLCYATSLKTHICLDKPDRESEPFTRAILQLENAYVLSFCYKCELKVFKQFFVYMHVMNVVSFSCPFMVLISLISCNSDLVKID